MTREEAIKLVKEVAGMSLDWDDAHYEALQMAIKALEQEPCEDAVSREDVIKAVDHHTFDTDDGLCLDDDISIILEELPPVKPTRKKGKWIKSNIGGARVCSNCQAHMGLSNFKFCPNCGAEMEGTKNDNG